MAMPPADPRRSHQQTQPPKGGTPTAYRSSRFQLAMITSQPEVIRRILEANTAFSEALALLSLRFSSPSFFLRCRRRLISCLRSLIPPISRTLLDFGFPDPPAS